MVRWCLKPVLVLVGLLALLFAHGVLSQPQNYLSTDEEHGLLALFEQGLIWEPNCTIEYEQKDGCEGSLYASNSRDRGAICRF